MPDDIKPLTSIASTPLVREKRHYPGDQQQEKQEKETSDEVQKTSDAVAQENEVDIDGKNVRVKHIDEFV